MFLTKAFVFLIEISLKASIVALFVLALKWTIGRKMSAKWHYLLWVTVVLALLIPMLPLNDLHVVKQVVPIPDFDIEYYSYGKLDFEPVIQQGSQKIQVGQKEVYEPANLFSKGLMFLSIFWLLGLVITLIYMLIINIYFATKIKRCKPLISTKILDQILEYTQLIGLKRVPQAYATSIVTVPAIFGIIKPKLLIPSGFEEQIEPREMQLILMHELLHIKRRDVIVNVFVSMVQAIHWFNPLLIYAFNHMRSDREMACDEMVLQLSQKNEQFLYGSLIIKLLKFRKVNYPASLTGMSINKKFMKRRIYMITQFGNKRKYLRFIAAVIFILASIFTVAFTLNNNAQASEDVVIHPGQIIVDDIDLPFVDDSEVLGEWESVDFVKEIEDFNPGERNTEYELYMTKLIFLENGVLKFNDDQDRPWFKWTKGVVTHSGDNTASKYIIEGIDDSTYMFFEWKSGDYSFRGMDPYYYVLKKVE